MIFRLGITERQKCHCLERRGVAAAELFRCFQAGFAGLDDLGQGRIREQAGDGQGQLRLHAAALDDDDAAADLGDALDGAGHVAVVGADDDDVVRVVGDRRGHRALLQAEAADEAEPDAARRQVALDDGDLQEVARRVGDCEPVLDGELLLEGLGDDLPFDETDDARAPPSQGMWKSFTATGSMFTVDLTHSGTSTRGISSTGLPALRTSSGSKRSRSGRSRMSAW